MWFASRKYRLERRAARAFGLKDYAGATRALEDLLEVVGENPNTLHVLAICRQRLGDNDAAIVAAERGLVAESQHLSSLKLLAEAHAARNDMETARSYALRALALLPREPRTWGLFALMRRLTRSDVYSPGTSAEERDWARWARALCESAGDSDNQNNSI